MSSLSSLLAQRFSTRSSRRSTPAEPSDPHALRQLATRLTAFRRDLEVLQVRRTVSTSAAARARVTGTALAISDTATPTTLRSTAEINATPTSFTPFGPSFAGSSTSLATIGGTYSGASGTDTLTFRVLAGGVVGAPILPLRLGVFNGQGSQIDTLTFTNLPANTPVTAANGLKVSLSGGTIVLSDTFQVSVSASVGSSVDPTKPFNGTRNNNPGFEAGVAVTAGSFTVNGVAISVLANDSINAVVAKITGAGAGVTATFDAASERIVLTRNIPGSAQGIVVANDTSGFLVATKLAGAAAVPGNDDDTARPIDDVSALAGISDGNFQINDISFAVDTGTDTLDGLIAAINASAAGVAAGLTQGDIRFTIAAKSAKDDMALSDGTSGVFTALGIATGTYEPRGSGTSGTAFENPEAVRRDLAAVAKQVNGVFNDSFRGINAAIIEAIRNRLRDAIVGAFGSSAGSDGRSILRSGVGFSVDLRAVAPRVVALDMRKLERAQAQQFDALSEFLFRKPSASQGGGLIVGLIASLEVLEGDLTALAGAGGSLGLLVDATA